jgi:hypothetical protein
MPLFKYFSLDKGLRVLAERELMVVEPTGFEPVLKMAFTYGESVSRGKKPCKILHHNAICLS